MNIKLRFGYSADAALGLLVKRTVIHEEAISNTERLAVKVIADRIRRDS
jgi:hypothetical protein